MSDFQGHTETTNAAPRPDWPIAQLGRPKVCVTPEFIKGLYGGGVRAPGGGKCKRVWQYTLEGVLVAVYPSVEQAASAMRIASPSIAKAARGEQKTTRGYRWEYLADNTKGGK